MRREEAKITQRSFYIFSNGTLRRKDNTVFIEGEEGRKYIPVEAVQELYVFGEVEVTKKFLEYASQREILVHFFNYYGYYSGTYYPREHRNSGYMTLKQAEHYLDEARRLALARRFVEGAIKNLRQVARYYHNRGRDERLAELVSRLEEALPKVGAANDSSSLMAVEGECREAYYGTWDAILKREDFAFERRSRRPPENRINALISFGNSILYTTVLSEIYKTHLDPRIGYLHATNFRRFTLNLDVAEIFKPIMVDRTIFTLVSKGMITAEDFEKESGGVFLRESARRRFIEQFDDRLKATVQHRHLGRNVSYRTLVRLELYKLEKHLMGEAPYEPFVSRW